VQKRSQEKVARILDCAAAMLSEPEAQLSARSLAQKADMGPATIYQYFADMDAVAAAVASRASETLRATLEREVAIPLAEDPQRFFHALITTIDELQIAHPEYGCMVRPSARSEFSAGVSQNLRDVTHSWLLEKLGDHAKAPASTRLELAISVMLTVLAKAPERDAPDRPAHLQLAARLGAQAFDAAT
jgi:AcrR family transcriptional regulator